MEAFRELVREPPFVLLLLLGLPLTAVGRTVRVDIGACFGDPRGEFCPEEAPELVLLLLLAGFDLDEDVVVVGKAEGESMATLVHSAHWKAKPFEGFRSMGGLIHSI